MEKTSLNEKIESIRNYKIEEVNTETQLYELYGNSALTIEGLSTKSIPDFIELLENKTIFTEEIPTVYITKGHIMNKFYGLTDENAYQDDLNIVSIIDIDPYPIIFERFKFGGRWFDDIVDNNLRHQQDLNKSQSLLEKAPRISKENEYER